MATEVTHRSPAEVVKAHSATTQEAFMAMRKAVNEAGPLLALAGLRDGVTLIMQRLLMSRGLREDDLDWIVVGGTTERYVAVKSGAAAGALVGQPLDFQGEAEGLRRLLDSSELTREWQF